MSIETPDCQPMDSSHPLSDEAAPDLRVPFACMNHCKLLAGAVTRARELNAANTGQQYAVECNLHSFLTAGCEAQIVQDTTSA